MNEIDIFPNESTEGQEKVGSASTFLTNQTTREESDDGSIPK